MIRLSCILIYDFPYHFIHLYGLKFLEYAVTTQKEEIIIFLYLELCDLWLKGDAVWNALELRVLGLYVTQGSSYG